MRNNGLLLLKPLLKSRFPINSKPKVLEFANFQRFFRCAGCKNNYRGKHASRIQSIVEQYKEMQKEAKEIT